MAKPRKPLPPLNALKSFESAARLRSLTRAAEELHVTQGAVSQQVKLLEEYLNTQLFVRKPRKLELTEAARAYLPIVTESFNNLTSSTMELFGQDHRTLLTIKCGSSFMQRWLAPRLADFYQVHPDIHLRMMASVWPSQTEVEEADLEISNGYGGWFGMRVEQLTKENWIVVASPDFLHQFPVNEDPLKIAQLPLISVLGNRENWQSWFREVGITELPPAPILESDTSTLALEAASYGVGLLLVRDFVAQPLLDSGQLALAHQTRLPASGAHYLVLPNKAVPPKVEAFCLWLKARLESEGANTRT